MIHEGGKLHHDLKLIFIITIINNVNKYCIKCLTLAIKAYIKM